MRAGLELVAAVGGLKTHAPLQTRVGIATGLVVVGDLIGSGASQEQAIVGETPTFRLACRALRGRTGLSLPKVRESSWAIRGALIVPGRVSGLAGRRPGRTAMTEGIPSEGHLLGTLACYP